MTPLLFALATLALAAQIETEFFMHSGLRVQALGLTQSEPAPCHIVGHVLNSHLRVEYLYSSSDNPSFEAFGPHSPTFVKARPRGETQYERMAPFDYGFFDIHLNWYFNRPENFAALVERVNPESKLFRVLRLVQMANEWVELPDGERRVAKEKEMLAYAAQGGPIESEFLVDRVTTLISTQKIEYGPFVPPRKSR